MRIFHCWVCLAVLTAMLASCQVDVPTVQQVTQVDEPARVTPDSTESASVGETGTEPTAPPATATAVPDATEVTDAGAPSDFTDSSDPAQGTPPPARPEVGAGLLEVMWTSSPFSTQAVVSLQGSGEVPHLHELSDGTLVGVGTTDVGVTAISIWTDRTAGPEVVRPVELPLVLETHILDDRYLALAVVTDFDAGEAHVEIWDLDDLDRGAIWVDDKIWSISGQILDLEGPSFLLAGRRVDTGEGELAIRSIEDPAARELVFPGFHEQLTSLSDGRVATAAGGVAIFDPTEPERDPIESVAWGIYNISELGDGRIASGWLDVWRVHDPVTGEIEEFAWPYERNIAAPTAFGDSQLVINVGDGLELYDVTDLTQPVARFSTPDTGLNAVYGLGMTVTDTHAVALDLTGGGLWVFDLTQPDQPAASFRSTAVVLGLRDGQIASQTDSGVVIWHPRSVTNGLSSTTEVANPGALCRVVADGQMLWAASDTGVLVSWLVSQDAPARVLPGHAGPVVALGLADGQVVSVGEDQRVLFHDAIAGDRSGSVELGGVIVSAAVGAGQIALGDSDGTVSVVDLSDVEAEPVVLFVGEGTTATSVHVWPNGSVSSMHLDGVLRVYDQRERSVVAEWDLGRLASEHVVSADGLIVVPSAGALQVFDPTDPAARPGLLRLEFDDYFPPIVMDDGRVAVVATDGRVVAGLPGDGDEMTATGSMDGAFSGQCLTGMAAAGLTTSGLTYVSNQQVVIAEIPAN